MKTASRFILLALVVLVCSPLWAMPFHPSVQQRINRGELGPYRFESESELHARGIDTPSGIPVVDRLRAQSLDENKNILAILVDFSDKPSTEQPIFFDSLLFGSAVGTVRNYYEEVSFGNVTLVCVNMPSSLGWQRAPETYAYYVDGQAGLGAYPHNAQKLAEDAVQLVDPLVDFSNYDNDGDGFVDALVIIHAGPGREITGSMNDIHSHKWQMNTAQNVDGVTASVYSIEPEYWYTEGDMTCGVYCHELGHALFGFPDLYDYGYDSQGLGAWTLMAMGSWNGTLGASPAHPDAYCEILAGFVNPTVIIQNTANVSIPNVETSPSIFRLWTNGTQNDQYFLVENREHIGYDTELPGTGLLIYHVDESVQTNDDNQWYPGHTTGGHYLVAVEQSDGNWDLEHNTNAGDASDPYPGSLDFRAFANSTTPNSKGYAGANTYVGVRNISDAADTMTADFSVRMGAGNAVGLMLPNITAHAGDSLTIPVSVDDVTGQNITSFHFTVTFDSTVVNVLDPWISRAGTIVPAAWTVTQTHTGHSITIDGTGATVLSGQGTLVSFVLRVLSTDSQGTVTALTFSGATINGGGPTGVAVDPTDGTVTVGITFLQLRPAAVPFGDIRLWDRAVEYVIVRNLGTTAVILDSMVTTAPFSTNFLVADTLRPNRWWSLHVYFAPEELGAYNGDVLVYCDGSPTPIPLPVSGNGIAPFVTISPRSLDFGNVWVERTAERTITLQNTDTTNHVVAAAELVNGVNFHFTANPTIPITLVPQQTVAYTIRFNPVVGPCSDSLAFAFDGAPPSFVPISGYGDAEGINGDGTGLVPTVFALHQNFPNPFNPSTSISFDVPKTSLVKITVYDVLGREVDSPLQAMTPAGVHAINWSCPGCASGVYLFVLTSGNVHLAQKAILMK
jgi:immune inhibitor A